MIDKVVVALIKNKHFVVIALAVLVIFAYAVPYGIDVEAKKGDNPGNHYGIVSGYGYGLNCDKHPPGKGPDPCRP